MSEGTGAASAALMGKRPASGWFQLHFQFVHTYSQTLDAVRAEHPSQPDAARWWPIAQGVGYGASLANQVADLLEGSRPGWAGWPSSLTQTRR